MVTKDIEIDMIIAQHACMYICDLHGAVHHNTLFFS